MPSVRKIYKQGNTPILSLPPHLIKAVGAVLGTTILEYPIAPDALLVEVHQSSVQDVQAIPRVHTMRASAVRTIYRQGNSFVCSFPHFLLEMIGLNIGDYLQLQRLTESSFTATALTAAQLLHKQALRQVSYHRDDRANAE